MWVLGHRGSRLDAPENTMAGFRLALTAGFDIETDVRMTADGELVLMHNATVDATTDGDGKLCEMTLAQIKRLDAGAWFAPHFVGQRVPTFEELLHLVADAPGRPVNIGINMKEYPEGIEDKIIRLLQRYRMVDRVIVFDATRDSLERFKVLDPAVPRCLTAVDGEAFAACLADELAVGLWLDSSIPVTADMIALAHDAGKRAFVTLVNDEPGWRRLAEGGVDGIATDYPFGLTRRLREIRG